MRAVSGSSHAGADHANCRCDHYLRHGWSHAAANVAVYPTVCQENSRFASGRDAVENQEYTRRQSALHIQYGVRSVQAVPAGEAEE